MPTLQPVRGTHDLLPADCLRHRRVVETFRTIAERYGFAEIATPIFEFTEVFKRTLGETSDVVTKEMYTFTDRGGDEITLRPEYTAGVARAFISGGLSQSLPLKFYCHGPMFRYERARADRAALPGLRRDQAFGAKTQGMRGRASVTRVVADRPPGFLDQQAVAIEHRRRRC